MRASQFLLVTHRETPADAELISHQLMLRAGMIRRLASGIYNWLPLGLRVLQKVENIVRTEMNRIGALEILMPAIQPAELWQETGRWQDFGTELLKMTDQNNREFCFGPTHEEVITDLVRREICSYKSLPLILYQIQTKFRDEIRPRFGVMRSREFLMKDAYSFHLDQQSLEQSYQAMFAAYNRIFTQMGVDFRSVLADSGTIGGNLSQEFHVLAHSGEDQLFYSDASDYAANIEFASAAPAKQTPVTDIPLGPLEKVTTPNKGTITEVSAYLDKPKDQMVKTLIVEGEQEPLIALILRGDHELNECKAAKHPYVKAPLQLANDAQITAKFNCSPGFLGPINIDIPIIVDHSAYNCRNFVCGANENDLHYCNANWQRDINNYEIADLRNVVVGDLSPDLKGTLQTCRGIEVGHIFQLGDKYSRAMNATVLNKHGKAIPVLMGCYGLGISRVVAAVIEQNHDNNGIIWPQNLAPFTIALAPINMHKSARLTETCEKLYHSLTQANYQVLFDDRNERPGVKFADLDLIGIPHRLVLSEKLLDQELIEYKARNEQQSKEIRLTELSSFLEKVCKPT